MFRTAAAVALAGLLSLAACSGDDDGSSPATDAATTPADATAAAESTAPAGNGNTITISEFAFSGATEVPVGTTVIVTNDDSANHTWTASDGSFDSGSLAPGDSFEFTFTEAGTFEYVCNFHPAMTGTITVTG